MSCRQPGAEQGAEAPQLPVLRCPCLCHRSWPASHIRPCPAPPGPAPALLLQQDLPERHRLFRGAQPQAAASELRGGAGGHPAAAGRPDAAHQPGHPWTAGRPGAPPGWPAAPHACRAPCLHATPATAGGSTAFLLLHQAALQLVLALRSCSFVACFLCMLPSVSRVAGGAAACGGAAAVCAGRTGRPAGGRA